jgi:hypothetical protein
LECQPMMKAKTRIRIIGLLLPVNDYGTSHTAR